MAAWVGVFCHSDRAITRRTIADFIEDGVYFDQQPYYEPSLDSQDNDIGQRWLVISYEPDKHPIVIWHSTKHEGRDVSELVQEAIDELDEADLPVDHQGLIRRLQATKQVFYVEFRAEEVTDECWQMLFAVEAFLARDVDGMIYRPEQGIYDANFEPICTFQ